MFTAKDVVWDASIIQASPVNQCNENTIKLPVSSEGFQ